MSIKLKDFIYYSKENISAPSADIIPKCHYIRTIRSDINMLAETANKKR